MTFRIDGCLNWWDPKIYGKCIDDVTEINLTSDDLTYINHASDGPEHLKEQRRCGSSPPQG